MGKQTTPPTRFWTIATDRTVVARAFKIALIVGTVIALINHGDKVATGAMTGIDWLKCALTFLVPYSVSTYSSVMAVRDRLQSLGND
ncbi:nitrate/nitrite transporter NrtS [uncultured Tateyamaria sp.]|uniref:nitrate/nitrite transporter NrtS n=1 Tax=uncultured Tateyamaria sp. TaxID=455651 RepID=UPI0026145674|nr:nitrate/nitrite transporter NrtS [uncultured Tateyamaria sp.]